MNQELLCTWLGLPKTTWPPDAWALLGLPREVRDLGVIEKRVQDRMCQLRNYQLSYPEEATEGMNRLAEAFITLTESCSKLPPRIVAPAPAKKKNVNGKTTAKDETAVTSKTKLDWRAEPPPVRDQAPPAVLAETPPASQPEYQSAPPPVRAEALAPKQPETQNAPPPVRAEALAPKQPEATPPPIQEEFAETPQAIEEEECAEILVAKPFAPPPKLRRVVDAKLIHDLAEESEEATSNLATLEAVIERVDQTRILLHAWDRVGRQFKCTNKKISPKESDAYAARLDQIAKTMQTYPAFLGHPGKPGYRVVVQARLRMPLALVRGMSKEQREELLFDWQAGRQVLLAHRKYLHRLFKSMRHRTTAGLVLHAIRAFVNDHPLPMLLSALALAVVIVGGVCAWMCNSK